MCSEQKRGLTELPLERIAGMVHPSEMQQPRLDDLREANDQAVAILQAACPDRLPRTPMDRLGAIESSLDAMIHAAKAIQPALRDFYGSLTDEQKAHMNALTRLPWREG
jgi:LTXXQ motif family protein